MRVDRRAKRIALKDMSICIDIDLVLLKEFNERRLEGITYDHSKSNRNY